MDYLIKQPPQFEYDKCMMYRPKVDRAAFTTDLQLSKGTLIEMLPSSVRSVLAVNEKAQNYMLVLTLVPCSLFVLFGHHLPYVSRLKDTWKMFSLKASVLVGSYLWLDYYMTQKKMELGSDIWNAIRVNYRKFVREGDLLQLNPEIELVGQPLGVHSD